MAKTIYKEVTTVGPIEWAKIFESNREMEGYEGAYADCDGAYTVVQILTKEELEKLKKTGSQKKPNMKRLTEDGVLAVKFERKHEVKTKDGTVIAQAGGAPKVFGPDGKPWDVEVDGLIGNGTIAEVTNLVSTFPGQDGKPISRTSILKIKVLEHVPYARQNNEEAA